MSTSQDSTLRSIGSGSKGLSVDWSVGGERHSAVLRVVRRDTADLPRPGDLPLPQSLAPVFGQPQRTQRSGLRAA